MFSASAEVCILGIYMFFIDTLNTLIMSFSRKIIYNTLSTAVHADYFHGCLQALIQRVKPIISKQASEHQTIRFLLWNCSRLIRVSLSSHRLEMLQQQ